MFVVAPLNRDMPTCTEESTATALNRGERPCKRALLLLATISAVMLGERRKANADTQLRTELLYRHKARVALSRKGLIKALTGDTHITG